MKVYEITIKIEADLSTLEEEDSHPLDSAVSNLEYDGFEILESCMKEASA